MKILKKFSKNTLKCTVYVENWCFNFPNWLVENALLFNGAIISTIYLSYFCYQKLMKIYIFIILHIGILKKNLVFVVKKWKKCEKIFNKKKYKYDHMNFGISFRKFVFFTKFYGIFFMKICIHKFFFLVKIVIIEFFLSKIFLFTKIFLRRFFHNIFANLFCIWCLRNNVFGEIFYSKFCLLRIFSFCNFGVQKKNCKFFLRFLFQRWTWIPNLKMFLFWKKVKFSLIVLLDFFTHY